MGYITFIYVFFAKVFSVESCNIRVKHMFSWLNRVKDLESKLHSSKCFSRYADLLFQRNKLFLLMAFMEYYISKILLNLLYMKEHFFDLSARLFVHSFLFAT